MRTAFVTALLFTLLAGTRVQSEEAFGRAAIGHMIFFDSRVSRTNTTACSTCHRAKDGWADGLRLAVGNRRTGNLDAGDEGIRNTPTVLLAHAKRRGLFLDGRATDLRAQALLPIVNRIEMGNASVEEVCTRLNRAGYRQLFDGIYGTGGVTPPRLAECLSAFEHTITVDKEDVPFYQWLAGDTKAMSAEAAEGYRAFAKHNCVACHKPSNWFRDDDYHNVGASTYFATGDTGRQRFTRNAADIGKFSTPTLICADMTAPYFHHGDVPTLIGAIEFFNRGAVNDQGVADPDRDRRIRPLGMTAREKKRIETFIVEGLRPHTMPKFSKPLLPGEPGFTYPKR